jgi:hypothetical protein
MESIVHNTAKDTADNPPPKKKQRRILIAPMTNCILAGSTSNDIELNMKHVTIAATVNNNNYYNKQYYLCTPSANCTNNNSFIVYITLHGVRCL